jgi:hypothetical protein
MWRKYSAIGERSMLGEGEEEEEAKEAKSRTRRERGQKNQKPGNSKRNIVMSM